VDAVTGYAKNGGTHIAYSILGDGPVDVLAVSTMTVATEAFGSPTQAVRCARSIVDASGAARLDVRAGIHTGECEQRGGDLAGLAVHIAARVAAAAGAGDVIVSRTVRDLVGGSEMRFVDRGEHELRGVPERWQLFALER
jgi:class 3 adenylate cyclase